MNQDVTQAIITALWNLLVQDPNLVDLMPDDYAGPLTKAPADTTMPFMVHRVNTLDGLDLATKPAVYTIEIWDYGTDMGARIWPVRARLMALLHQARINVPQQGILRLWHVSETQMPNEDTSVMTLALTFDARYARAGEVSNQLLAQKGHS